MYKYLSLLLLIIVPLVGKSQCFQGNYKIGKVGSDFSSIQAAVDSLEKNGVCGPVIFDIQAGIYGGTIEIDSIPGSSFTNNITFKSESNDPNQVTILAYSSVSHGLTLKLKNARYLRFKYLTFERKYTYTALVGIEESSHNILIDSCKLIDNVPFEWQDYDLIQVDANKHDSLRITNNTFLRGKTAINFLGSIQTKSSHLQISKNEFYDQRLETLDLNNLEGPSINENIFLNTTGDPNTGIRILNSSGVQIHSNILNVGRGIDMSSVTGTPTSLNKIYNNIINSTNFGLALGQSNNFHIHFNTIVGSTSLGAIDLGTGDSTFILYNNVIANTHPTGYIYRVYYSFNATAERNVYFFNDTTFAKAAYSSNYYNFNQWTSTGKDTTSIIHLPQFTGPYGAHIMSDSLINNFAFPIPGINRDVYGQLRNTATPDPGAHEFTNSPGPDVAIVGFNVSNASCNGVLNPEVYLKNNSADTLHYAKIQFNIGNTTTSTTQWQGNLPPGDTTSIPFPYFNYPYDTTFNLEAKVSEPNYLPDPVPYNDVAQFSGFSGKLKGNYIINGPNADFYSIKDALHAVQTRGICGSVELQISSGYYELLDTIKPIPGASYQNRVTVTSLSGDSSSVVLNKTIYPSSVKQIFLLDSAEHLTFKKIGFRHPPLFLKNVKDIGIENLHLDSVLGSYSDDLIQFSDGGTDIRIVNNFFKGTSYKSITFDGISGKMFKDIVISHNVFQWTGLGMNYDIYMGLGENVTIEGNEFSSDVHVGAIGTVSIQKNLFFRKLSSNGPEFLFSGGNGHCRLNMVNNAFVGAYKKIHLFGIDSLYYLHNTVNCKALAYPFFQVGTPAFGRVYNNIFFIYNNILNNSIIRYVGVQSYGDFKSDYNLFFDPNNSSKFWKYYEIEFFAPDLPLIPKITGQEANSIFANPIFKDSLSFEVQKNFYVADRGIDLGTTGDFYGNLRDSFPDIGAFESSNSTSDLSIALGSGQSCQTNLNVIIRNLGKDTLLNFKIYIKIDTSYVDSISYTGQLLSKTNDTIFFSLPILPDGSYTGMIWHNGFNGTQDDNPHNDTLITAITIGALNGTYQIGGASSDFLTINAAVEKLNKVGICGPVIFNINPGIYNEQIEISVIKGVSENNTIVFQSSTNIASDVIIEYTSSFGPANFVLNFKRASHITFRNCTIIPQDSFFAIAVRIWDFSSNISIKGCRITGTHWIDNSNNDRHHRSIIKVEQASTILIQNNEIRYGAFGLDLSDDSYLVSIRENNIDSFLIRGLYSRCNGIEVAENIIRAENSTSSLFTAIDIKGNKIYSKIEGNKVFAHNSMGISFQNTPSWLDPGRTEIVNNMIVLTGTQQRYGLQVLANEDAEINHNTIFSTNTHNLSSSLFIGSPAKSISNNILVNIGNGFAFWLYTPDIETIRNNCYYSKGSALNKYVNTNFPTMTSWVNQMQDSTSINGLPQFVSNTDLHLANDTLVGKMGTFLPEVLIDIDSNFRKLTPDIGAHEFSPPPNYDAGMVEILLSDLCIDSSQVHVKIKSFGLNVTNVDINLAINDTIVLTQFWNGNLPIYQESDSIFLGHYLFNPGQSYSLKAWTSIPGQSDPTPQNDTVWRSFVTQPAISLGSDQIICNTSQVTIQADSSYSSYIWSNGTNTSTITVSSGLFSLLATDSVGCRSSDTVEIVSVAPLGVNLGNDTMLCPGDSILLNAGVYGEYLWSTSDTTISIIASSSGSFTIEVIDSFGCISKDTIDVTFSPYPQVSLGTDTSFCTGDSLYLSVNPNYNSYSWSTGETGPTALADSGVVSIHVTDMIGCASGDSINIMEIPIPILNLGVDTIICNSDSLLLNPGTYAAYNWSTGSSDSFLMISSPGTYSLAVTNPYGCSTSDSINISIPPPVDLGGNKIKCIEDTLILTVSAPFASYNWSTGSTSFTTAVVSPGVYSLAVTDSIGCMSKDSILITNYPVPNISIQQSDTSICNGDSVLLAGTGGFNYSWSPNTYLSAPTSSSTFSNPTSTITYTLHAIDSNLCSGFDSIKIEVVAPLVVPPLVLSGDTLTTVMGYSYQWYKNFQLLPNSNSHYLIVSDTGFYFVEVYQFVGCSAFSDTLQYKSTGMEIPFKENALIKIYPQPTNSLLFIESDNTSIAEVVLYEMSGARLATFSFNDSKAVLDLGKYAAGSYLIEVVTEQSTKSYHPIILNK